MNYGVIKTKPGYHLSNILGIIYFGMFTPYSIVMKVMGRDELRLKQKNNKSYWINRSQTLLQTDFKKQF